jgi:chromate transporter
MEEGIREPVKGWRLIWQLFWTFFKIGPVTFGGGYAMIPLIEREIVERNRWLTSKDIADVFAVSESIPGAIAINSATFVGYRVAGIRGAMAAMLGVLLPTFLIVTGLCIVFLQVRDNPKIEAAFKGIRPVIVALIVFAGIKIGHTAVIDKTSLVLVVATVSVLLVVHFNPVLVIGAGAVIGVLLVRLKARLGMPVALTESEHPKYSEPDWFIAYGI